MHVFPRSFQGEMTELQIKFSLKFRGEEPRDLRECYVLSGEIWQL